LLQGHIRSLTQIKYNRQGDLIFTASKDNIVNIWYAHNGERLGTLDGHVGSIWSVDPDQFTQLCVTGSADNTARLWDIQTGKLLYTWTFNTAVKRVQWSRDSKYILMITEQRMGFPSTLVVFEINRDDPSIQDIEPVCRILPQGSKATVAGWSYLNKWIITGHEDGTISQYDWKNESCVKQVQKAHMELITDIQFSADATYFVTSSKDKTAKLYETSTLKLLKVYNTDTPLNSATITPTQDFIVVGGGQEAMDVTTTSQRQGKFECRFHHKILMDECGRVKGHFGPINTIAVHPNGQSFSSGGEDGFVRVHYFDDDYFKFQV
jgi:translation initiation factor 3 subunit I